MSCNRYEAQLSAMVDGELNGRTAMAVRDHLRECPGCTAQMEQLKAIKRNLSAMPIPEPSLALESRLSAITAPKPVNKAKWLVVTAGTMALLLAVGGTRAVMERQAEERRSVAVRESMMRVEMMRDQGSYGDLDSGLGGSVGIFTSTQR